MSPDFIIIEKSGPISGPDRVETFWSGPELSLDFKTVHKLQEKNANKNYFDPVNDRILSANDRLLETYIRNIVIWKHSSILERSLSYSEQT